MLAWNLAAVAPCLSSSICRLVSLSNNFFSISAHLLNGRNSSPTSFRIVSKLDLLAFSQSASSKRLTHSRIYSLSFSYLSISSVNTFILGSTVSFNFCMCSNFAKSSIIRSNLCTSLFEATCWNLLSMDACISFSSLAFLWVSYLWCSSF